MTSVLAQATPDTSSAAAVVFGVVVLVGGLSVVALTSKGRRSLLPLVAVSLGLLIGATSITDWLANSFTALTLIGLFFGMLLVMGGFGALREGLVVPEVEGRSPDLHPPSAGDPSKDLTD